VIPSTPIPVSRLFTSSNWFGLMIESMRFIAILSNSETLVQFLGISTLAEFVWQKTDAMARRSTGTDGSHDVRKLPTDSSSAIYICLWR
jgi:hypothetical protein